MTDQEILLRAVEKAYDNGYIEGARMLLWIRHARQVEFGLYAGIIFNPKFAQALWGFIGDDKSKTNNWYYHLQQMVVTENPLKYLGEHI